VASAVLCSLASAGHLPCWIRLFASIQFAICGEANPMAKRIQAATAGWSRSWRLGRGITTTITPTKATTETVPAGIISTHRNGLFSRCHYSD